VGTDKAVVQKQIKDLGDEDVVVVVRSFDVAVRS